MVAGVAFVFTGALILWAPGGFRLTCYYYRGAYYKAFWADPPACTVGEPRKTYLGERSFPLIMQNVHRYFLYLALIFILILAYDVWKAMWFADPAGGKPSFGIGIGTIVLAINVVLLSGYTFGCHSRVISSVDFSIVFPKRRPALAFIVVSAASIAATCSGRG